ncbi:O-antigen ligase family protein [Pedobacter sp. MC2016-14]|uniref:O-antigen ligase family protein n=1 Tax=Pedobacter sp. MC2016-14 TaxID=2897327 RepID=UPI001E3FD185|nr:O-antigen ligase family protein [Pedobacter sp. MC2016-14]MCD0490218.1 O-antigen ligase family protein [Pedobacter sp. MC2016-14]
MKFKIALSKITPLMLLAVTAPLAILLTLGTFYYGLNFGVLVFIILIGIPVAISVIIYPKFGIVILLTFAYVIALISRLGVHFPLGTVMDGLELLLILGFLIYQKQNPGLEKFKNTISYIILAWIGYNLLQFFNPTAESRLAWVYTIRSVAAVMIMYFVFMTQIRTVNFVRLILKLWIGLAFFAALYAFKSEHLGFFQFEKDWLASDPNLSTLYFIAGHWRKSSIFSDPVAFSYNMVTSSILCLTLMMNNMKVYKKIILGFLVVFFMLNMLYSGTRGANVLLPAAIFLLAILKFNYRVLGLSILGMIFLAILVYMPTSNQNLIRFQSAFRPSDDPSFNLRGINQKRIQPFIQTHPFGGGLGATGTWGERFAPNSYLAHFPPDSGYVRVAVELGFVGLILFCTLMFTILKTGITNYYKIKDPELKGYCLAMVLIIFALNIGNYPQEALVQFPTSIYFYLFVALINVTLILDKEKQQEELSKL